MAMEIKTPREYTNKREIEIQQYIAGALQRFNQLRQVCMQS